MDITNEHHYAITLAGTVAVPSPYPSSGRASFVLTDWDDDAVIYVKLVQVINRKQIITWFVKPEDIRAVRFPASGDAGDPDAWPILSPAKTRKAIADGEAAIVAHAKKAGVKSLEQPWESAMILYISEAAPVLHRRDVALTAAESVEGSPVASGRVCCG